MSLTADRKPKKRFLKGIEKNNIRRKQHEEIQKMNEAIYRLADSGGSVRIVIQKKPDGDYIVGISNGKDTPLICQGKLTQVDAEFDAALASYLEALKAAAIEAKLNAAVDEPEVPAAPITLPETKNEQPELDFGF
jgi:hypothetical protein